MTSPRPDDELTYESPHTRRKNDEDSHDRYMLAKMCRMVAISDLVLGIVMPIAEVQGVIMLGFKPSDMFITYNCVVFLIAILHASLFFYLSSCISAGGIPSVVVALVMGSFACLACAGIALLALAGILGTNSLSDDLLLFVAEGLFAIIYGRLLYHGIRVLKYRGNQGERAYEEADIMGFLRSWTTASALTIKPQVTIRRVLLGFAMFLGAFNLLYFVTVLPWLRESMETIPKTPWTLVPPVLSPAVDKAALASIRDFYDLEHGLPAAQRAIIVDYCASKVTLSAERSRQLDWMLRESGALLAGTWDPNRDRVARLFTGPPDEYRSPGYVEPNIRIHFRNNQDVFFDDRRCIADPMWPALDGDVASGRTEAHWAYGAIDREMVKMRAEMPAMTDAQSCAIAKLAVDSRSHVGGGTLTLQGSIRASDGLLTMQAMLPAVGARYITGDGRVYERAPEVIAAEYADVLRAWEASTPQLVWGMHWSGPGILLLDATVGFVWAVWLGVTVLWRGVAYVRAGAAKLVMVKLGGILLSLVAPVWFLLLWLHTSHPAWANVVTAGLVAGVGSILLIRILEVIISCRAVGLVLSHTLILG